VSIVPGVGKTRVLNEAIIYKRAWAVAAMWVGNVIQRKDELSIPRYDALPRKVLEQEARELRKKFNNALDLILGKPRTNAVEGRALKWFSGQYDIVVNAEGPVTLCTLHEFVSSVAPTVMQRKVDAPPYTELLMQGSRGLAYRHPEYMLARDVEFNHSIFWQTEELVANHALVPNLPNWVATAGENVQSLARAAILSCFSLLESTVSGLGRAYEMTHPALTAQERKVLINNHGPLLERLFDIPMVIVGKPLPLRKESLPLSRLFGEIKQRRDAFMHCEPGDQRARAGFVKQDRFHDVTADGVDDAVQLTVEVVQVLWQHVHGVDKGPAWLRNLGNRSSYRPGLRVMPNE
jgi:hypothetical protein